MALVQHICFNICDKKTKSFPREGTDSFKKQTNPTDFLGVWFCLLVFQAQCVGFGSRLSPGCGLSPGQR